VDFPPESVELLSLDNRIEMVKFIVWLIFVFITYSTKLHFQGEMVTVLLPPFAKVMFILSLSGYLFGDLSIYYKAIGESLVDFTW